MVGRSLVILLQQLSPQKPISLEHHIDKIWDGLVPATNVETCYLLLPLIRPPGEWVLVLVDLSVLGDLRLRRVHPGP